MSEGAPLREHLSAKETFPIEEVRLEFNLPAKRIVPFTGRKYWNRTPTYGTGSDSIQGGWYGCDE